MIIHSSDLLGTAEIAANSASATMKRVRESNDLETLHDLLYAEAKLTQALAELRAARWGVERRNPAFDSQDLNLLVDGEVQAIRGAHDWIPAASIVRT